MSVLWVFVACEWWLRDMMGMRDAYVGKKQEKHEHIGKPMIIHACIIVKPSHTSSQAPDAPNITSTRSSRYVACVCDVCDEVCAGYMKGHVGRARVICR